MSLFRTVSIVCPKCEQTTSFEAASSVNAERRPQHREAIRRGSFQVTVCRGCAERLRLDPRFSYVDPELGLWIGAYETAQIERWEACEAEARSTFDRTLGHAAPAPAREIGRGLEPRVTFGWSGLLEKIEIARLGLDDVWIEACKAALLATVDNAPVGPSHGLRFLGSTDGWLDFAFLDHEKVIRTAALPRSTYDEMIERPAPWAMVTEPLRQGVFVDLDRLLLQSPADSAH